MMFVQIFQPRKFSTIITHCLIKRLNVIEDTTNVLQTDYIALSTMKQSFDKKKINL